MGIWRQARRRLYRRYTVFLRDRALSGRTRPSFVVTHYGGLDDARGLFRILDEFVDGAIKVVCRPRGLGAQRRLISWHAYASIQLIGK